MQARAVAMTSVITVALGCGCSAHHAASRPSPATSSPHATAASSSGRGAQASASEPSVVPGTSGTPSATITSTKSTSNAQQPPTGARWLPGPGTTWQWELDHPLTSAEAQLRVDAFDIDGFDNSAATVAVVHAGGAKAICYVDVGTAENWRPDFAGFPASTLGADNGWPGERWLDIRQLTALAPVMAARFQMCRDKGFDAVEADNIDGFDNKSGFPLSASDQLAYNTWVAQTVHRLGMSVAQKNDDAQVASLVGSFDFAIVEQCVQYSTCAAYSPYVQRHRAVLDVEYSTGTGFCATLPAGIDGMAKHLKLDAYRVACPG